MGICIEIVDWDVHYENNRTRELKKMAWVPMPNRHDGDGYTELLNHENGTAHFGAWCALVEVASKCGNPAPSCGDMPGHPFGRGILLRSTGEPHDSESLSRITRIPVSIWEDVLKRLVIVGWIRYCEISAVNRRQVRKAADSNGSKPQAGAEECPMNGTERNGKERKGRGGGEDSPFSASPSEPQEKDLYTFVDNRIPQEGMPMMLEIMEIHRKATGGAEMPRLTDEEMSQLLALFRQHDGPVVVAAYRAHQGEKPGKAFKFFLQDFAQYFARAPRAPGPPPAHCDYCGADGAHTATCNRPGNGNGLPPPDDFDDDFPEAK